MTDDTNANYRQILYWRMISAMFGYEEHTPNFEQMTATITDEVPMPGLILKPDISTDNFLQRYPELEGEFTLNLEEDGDSIRRALIVSRLLLSVFGPSTQTPNITAAQYTQWLKDVGHLERALGHDTGGLRGKGGSGGQGGGVGASTEGSGNGGINPTDDDLRQVIKNMENDLIERMQLHEVLKDDQLANQLQPSMALVEQLLREKSHISGKALGHAKRIIQQYISELADVLRLQVHQAPSGKIDRSVPPRKTFRNLDLKRTIWRNLPNYDPENQRLFVNQLYYHQTTRKKLPIRLIVVVDQSGSMVDAMVQCTILASIFAGLPNVDVHLIAFDTQVIDLTAYVHDPFEVLMRTQLGGGTHINYALTIAEEKILEPRQTAMVLITDFYEGGSHQILMNTIKRIIESGVHFFPVGAVTSSGYFSVDSWFRTQLKEMGRPILTGSPKKLIRDLKQIIAI
jgi:hypothetical protein